MHRLLSEARWGKGTSQAAERRRARRNRGTLYQGGGKHTGYIEMSDRVYTVGRDGVFHFCYMLRRRRAQ